MLPADLDPHLVAVAVMERLGADLDAARRTDRTRAVLLAAAAHDAKGPLSAIAGYGQILAAHPELDPPTRSRMFDSITDSVRRLDELLSDLNRVNAWLDGPGTIEVAPVDLGALVERIASTALVGAHPYSIDVPAGPVTIDAARVGRIVENLLVNVTRHTPPGTSVEIRAEVSGAQTSHAGLLLGVDDDGPGVPASLEQGLFGVPAEPGASSGVGLSIVKALTESLGGRAWVVARRGGGAAFRVWIPTANGLAPASDARRAAQERDRSRESSGPSALPQKSRVAAS